jgi:hypothetical protein
METVNLAMKGKKSVDQRHIFQKNHRIKRFKTERSDEFDSYSQKLGSVAYGLPCLAVTRRTAYQQKQLRDCERINTKLSKIMRHPNDFIDVEG